MTLSVDRDAAASGFSPHDRTTLLMAIASVLAAHGVMEFVFGGAAALNGQLIGPDSYMRLQRVLELYERGHWFAPHESRINAPYGETLPHWSRAMDGILLGGTWLLNRVLDVRTALLVWGSAFKLLLLVLLVPIWSWGTRSFLARGPFILSLVLIVLLPQLYLGFKLGRTDHHGLLSFLFLAQLAIVLRIASCGGGPRAAALAGVVGAFAIWVSVEALVQTLFVSAVLWVLWICRDSRILRCALCYALGLCLGLAIALVLEHPPARWTTALFSRLSVVHLVLALATAGSWALVLAAQARFGFGDGLRARLASALVAAGVPFGITLAIFPQFLEGPFADFDTGIVYAWLATIPEYRPTLPTSWYNARRFFRHLGATVIAIAYIVYRWRDASPEERNAMTAVSIGLVIFVPLALGAVRWATYVQSLTLLPWALAICAASRWPASVALLGRPLPLRSVAVLMAVTGPIMIATIFTSAGPSAGEERGGCAWQQMIDYLDRHHQGGPADDTVLT